MYQKDKLHPTVDTSLKEALYIAYLYVYDTKIEKYIESSME